MARGMAEKSLYNLLEICPLGRWGSSWGSPEAPGYKPAEDQGASTGEGDSCWPLGATHPYPRRPRVLQEPFSSYSVFVAAPLPTKLNTMPAGKGKIFKGTRTVFTEQAKMVNLELRSSKSITSTPGYGFDCIS